MQYCMFVQRARCVFKLGLRIDRPVRLRCMHRTSNFLFTPRHNLTASLPPTITTTTTYGDQKLGENSNMNKSQLLTSCYSLVKTFGTIGMIYLAVCTGTSLKNNYKTSPAVTPFSCLFKSYKNVLKF